MTGNSDVLSLAWWSGKTPLDLKAFLDQAVTSPPALSWLEPWPRIPQTGSTGPLPDFRGLAPGLPDLRQVMAEEIRLYWPGVMLQVLVDPDGCRWFACQDPSGTSLPVVLHPEHSDTQNVTVTLNTVYLRHPRERQRFLRRAGECDANAEVSPEKVKVVEYRNGARLFAWRIVPPATQ